MIIYIATRLCRDGLGGIVVEEPTRESAVAAWNRRAGEDAK